MCQNLAFETVVSSNVKSTANRLRVFYLQKDWSLPRTPDNYYILICAQHMLDIVHIRHPIRKTHEIVHAIVDFKDSVAYGDLTGKFPYRSSRGNQYILVTYHYDANHIRGEPLKNREAATITAAYN